MKDHLLKISTNFYLLFFIIVVAVFFRSYNYLERLNIQSDHSLFAQASFYAADNFIFPLIGPFAQAPFFTGPWWLWFLELIYLFPFGVNSAWVVMSLLSIVFVILIYWLGKEIGGKRLGLISAFLTAISPAQIANSFSVWNAAIDPLLALLATIFLIRFYKNKNYTDIFLLGFSVSLAFTIHFQTSLLLPLAFFGAIISKFQLKYLMLLFLGLIIPVIPFIYFDLRNNWFWFVSVFIYSTVDQYAIWVPNRWLTYLTNYWPQTWGSIVGGNQIIGALLILLLSVMTLLKLKVVRNNKKFFLIALTFLMMVIMFRYYRGERYFYFSNFAHPAVIILSSWVIVELYKFRKQAGLLLAGVIIVFTLLQSLSNLESNNVNRVKMESLKSEIYSNFPSNNFTVYGCSHNGALLSHPLALSMYSEGRDSLEGVNIGICFDPDNEITWNVISNKEVKSDGSAWLNHSSEEVYTSMTQWWKYNPPKEGNFWQYVKDHLDPSCHPYC